jgi:predicted NAD-dependent protein-ADP-ribosyltransferase YbiA (DUF1768 family)
VYHNLPELATRIISEAKNAGDAKALSKQIKVSAEWDEVVGPKTMVSLIEAKFDQCADFRRELYRSGRCGLIAHSCAYPGKDPKWSTNLSKQDSVRCSNGGFPGRNLFGDQLMRLRDVNWIKLGEEFGHCDLATMPATAQQRAVWPERTAHSHTHAAPAAGCGNCGVPGHSVATCKYRVPLRCHRCAGMGHKARYCKNAATGAPSGPVPLMARVVPRPPNMNRMWHMNVNSVRPVRNVFSHPHGNWLADRIHNSVYVCD